MTSLPPGLSIAARFVLQGALWVIRRPFLVHPIWLAGGVAICAGLGLAVGVWVAPILAAPCLLAALVLGSSRVYLWRLTRSEAPLVLLSRFESKSALGRDAAATHAAALARFLETDEFLGTAGPFKVRAIPVPCSDASARRLLQFPRVLMVIGGSGDASQSESHWDAVASYRRSKADVSLARYALSTHTNRVPSGFRSRFYEGVIPASSTRTEEGSLARDSFMAASLTVQHFRDLAKVLLVLLGEEFVADPGPKEPRTLLLPEPTDPVLDDPLRGRTLILEAEARRGKEPPEEIVRDIERRALDNEVDDEGLALWVAHQLFIGENESWATPEDSLASLRRWAARVPTSHQVAANVAGTLIRLGRLTEAESALGKASALGAPRPYVLQLRGAIAFERRDVSWALKLYRQARGRRRPFLRWQIGDCYALLGHPRRALHEYRAALRFDSTRVPAAERAREVAGWGRLLPVMPPGWRARLWRELHEHPRLARPYLRAWRLLRPEDPYLPTWLARHALVLGDVRTASTWNTYATQFAGTNRLIAQLDAVVLDVLMDDDAVEQSASFFARHVTWLEQQRVPEPRDDAKVALEDLLRYKHFRLDETSFERLSGVLDEVDVSFSRELR